MTNATATAPAVKSTAPANCKCGCGREANKGALYLPGHDARHVSILVKNLRNGSKTGVIDINSKEYRAAFGSLPSGALQAKFENAAANSNKKVEKSNEVKATREANRKAAEERKAAKAKEQAEAKAKAAESKTSEVLNYKEGTVKVGRWEYPTREFKDGSIERNEKVDGSGEWIGHTA